MILPSVFSPTTDPSADPANGGLWFVFHSNNLLVSAQTEQPALPRLSGGQSLPVPTGAPVLLGMAGATCCWGAVALTEEAPAGWAFEPLRGLFNRLPDDHLAIAGRAAQLLEFDRTHRFCGVCATPMQTHEDGRSRQCPNCGQTVYPRIAPAMMALIKRDGARCRELLLARNTRFPTAMYSALAGFVEPSESVEDCVHREVREEVGVSVRELRYFGSQSWPFPHSLMIAFVVDYEAGEIVCEDGEIADARVAEVRYVYKKQTGGPGQFADVFLRFEPGAPGSGFVFESKITGGAIPREFIPAVEAGVKKAAASGAVAGHPVVDFRAVLLDGSYHERDSSTIAFEHAAMAAWREAMQKVQPVVLEPLMAVEVVTPLDYVGDVIGDINRRRGHVRDQETRGNGIVIRADVPLREMFGYIGQLRALSSGRASFTMQFERYEPLPAKIALAA